MENYKINNKVDSMKNPEVKQSSELERILTKFDSKLKELDELTSAINKKVAVMIEFEIKGIDEKPELQSNALIGKFECRIEKLGDVNNRLDEILYNLVRLVG